MSSYIMPYEFQEHVERWMRKASTYECTEHSIYECYDKFWTLFVAYNALYTELTHRVLGRRQSSDQKEAKYVVEYIKARDFVTEIEGDSGCVSALATIAGLLNGTWQSGGLAGVWGLDGEPGMHVVYRSGEPDKGKDDKLYRDLTGANKDAKSHAILDLIYHVRCNMFHGRKGLHREQAILVGSVIVLLEKTIELLYQKLSSEGRGAP